MTVFLTSLTASVLEVNNPRKTEFAYNAFRSALRRFCNIRMHVVNDSSLLVNPAVLMLFPSVTPYRVARNDITARGMLRFDIGEH